MKRYSGSPQPEDGVAMDHAACIAALVLASASACAAPQLAASLQPELQPSRVKTIHQFSEEDEGSFIFEKLVLGHDGRLWGTATDLGPRGHGSLFRMSQHGHVVLAHAFALEDGVAHPQALTQGADGNFYVLASQTAGGWPALLRITPHGKVTVVYRSAFGAADCMTSFALLIQSRDGDFYLTDAYGNAEPRNGCIVRVSPHGHVSVLHRFSGTDGLRPMALVESSDGHFYGVTHSGGAHDAGTFFRMRRNGQVTLLYTFGPHEPGGPFPNTLVEGSDGHFYGFTANGGAYGRGTVFRLTRQGQLTVLHDFERDFEGIPWTLSTGRDGSLYGFTRGGDKFARGLAYRLTLGGEFTVLHAFSPSEGEKFGSRAMTEGQGGYFYFINSSAGKGPRAYQLKVVE
jgi:uncharacterized repeat protein (TIGR03803 family)